MPGWADYAAGGIIDFFCLSEGNVNQLASKGQLRMSLLRWALFCVPLVVVLGLLSGQLAPSGDENRWYAALVKPEANPPGYVFGIVWTILYAMMGFALALVLNARNAAGRWLAISAFAVQLALNLFWSPFFFGMHQVSAAFWLLLAILVMAIITTVLFARVRLLAAWLLVPYCAWLGFASALNYEIDRLNPNAETLVVPSEAPAATIAI